MGTEYEIRVIFNLILSSLDQRKEKLKGNENPLELINDIIKDIAMIRDDTYRKDY